MLDREEELKMIRPIIAKFPAEFGLRAYRGLKFKIVEGDCYYSENEGAFLLYVYVQGDDQMWRAFTKGTHNELMKEIVKL